MATLNVVDAILAECERQQSPLTRVSASTQREGLVGYAAHIVLKIEQLDIEEGVTYPQVSVPTPEQWARVKLALRAALQGPRTNDNITSQHGPCPNAHYIGIHPGDYDALMDALEFTTNEDLDIV